MNTNQFCLLAYQWVFANIIPSIAPKTWQQQLIAFNKGRELMDKLSMLANTLAKDEMGGIDIDDLETRVDDMFKVDPVFSFPINEPALTLLGISAEHTLKFSRADLENFFSLVRGNTTTTQVSL